MTPMRTEDDHDAEPTGQRDGPAMSATDMFACSRCGGRQASGDACHRCRTDSMHDLRSRRARQLFGDAEARYQRERGIRSTRYGAAIGVAVVVVLWLIPGYWDLFGGLNRGDRARRLFATQFGILVGVSLAAIAIVDRILPARRHPFLDTLPAADRD